MTTPEEAEEKRRLTLSEKLKEIRDAQTDKYTVAWLQRELAGLHQEMLGQARSIRLILNDLNVTESRAKKLTERVIELEKLDKEKDEVIGELRARLVAAETRLEEMSRWGTRVERRLPPEKG